MQNLLGQHTLEQFISWCGGHDVGQLLFYRLFFLLFDVPVCRNVCGIIAPKRIKRFHLVRIVLKVNFVRVLLDMFGKNPSRT